MVWNTFITCLWRLQSFFTQFEKYKKKARTATTTELMTRAILKGIVDNINSKAENIYCDEKKVTAGNIFCYFPQYDEDYNKLDIGDPYINLSGEPKRKVAKEVEVQ